MLTIIQHDATTQARLGEWRTPHGVVQTPAFMPVGSYGAVKALTSEDLVEAGVQIRLANVYHLSLRPGIPAIQEQGGLHRFIQWDRPILTDSGGYQVMSLAPFRKIREEGVEFQSHLDGSRHLLTPETVIAMQQELGVDVAMPLDVCLPHPCDSKAAREAVRLTTAWAKRSTGQWSLDGVRGGAQLFGIVQGATDLGLRHEAAEALVEIGFDGYALGGLSVGESKDQTLDVMEATAGFLPKDKLRYLMGVGRPEDLMEAVARGMDLFDCVIPTREGRHGIAFTRDGRLSLKTAVWAKDPRPPDEGCSCHTCRHYSRAYLHHLVNVREPSALRLISLHNIQFYVTLMQEIRTAIRTKDLASVARAFLQRYLHHERGVEP